MAWGFGGKTSTTWKDRPCWRCGYPLRSLPGGDVRNCPECGLAVRVSLSQNASLAMADPAWLWRQAVACGAVAVAVALAGVAAVSIEVIGPVVDRVTAVRMAAALVGLSTATLLAAWWTLATADRNQPKSPRPLARLIGRGVVGLILVLLALGAVVVSLGRQNPAGVVGLLVLWSSFAFGAMSAEAGHGRVLMERSQNRRLRKVLGALVLACYAAIIAPYVSGLFVLIELQFLRGGSAVHGSLVAATLTAATALAVVWILVARQVWLDRRAALLAWVSD